MILNMIYLSWVATPAGLKEHFKKHRCTAETRLLYGCPSCLEPSYRITSKEEYDKLGATLAGEI